MKPPPPPPPPPPPREVPPERRPCTQHARCAYCPPDAHPPLLLVTVHDRRGCKHCCTHHAIWRFGLSMMPGHARDCALWRREG